MATASKKSSKKSVLKDSNGNPDIVALRKSGLTMKQAAEAAGVSFPKAHDLMYKQEVEHDPSLKINAKSKTLGKQLAALREQNVRWERLSARTGLSVAECKAKVAEHLGVEVADLKRERAEAPKSSKKKKPAKKSAKKAAPVVEDDDEDEVEDEDEVDEDEVDDEDTEDDDDADDEDDSDDDEDDEEEEDEELPPPPAAKKGRKK
jgi:hypothetical protein